MRPTSSHRPSTRQRRRLDDLITKEQTDAPPEVEELNFRVKDRNTSQQPRGIFETLRESVVSRGPDQRIDVKETLKRPLTGLFRRSNKAQQQQKDVDLSASLSASKDEWANALGFTRGNGGPAAAASAMSSQNDLAPRKAEDSLDNGSVDSSVLNLNQPPVPTSSETLDFSAFDFAKFDDLDLSLLARLVCIQEEIVDDEEPWTWDSLFASVTTEMREEWAAEEEGADDEHTNGPFELVMQRSRQRWRLLALAAVILTVLLIYYISTNEIDFTPASALQSPIRILFYTEVFAKPYPLPSIGECHMKVECEYTLDHSYFPNADAVVFHHADIQINRSTAAKLRRSAININPTQKWVLFTQETPKVLDKTTSGTFWSDAIHFHWIMSYMKDAHVRAPYGFFVNPEESAEKGYKPIAKFSKDEIFKGKEIKGALWFVSNCNSQERLHVARELRKHMKVDIAGKCSEDPALYNLCPRNVTDNCKSIVSKYYFYFAFENENCNDYVTEKFLNYLDLPVILVVMKRRSYQRLLPADAFIAVDDYTNVTVMAAELQRLMNDREEYARRLEWRRKWAIAPWNADSYKTSLCALCEKLQNGGRNEMVTPIQDLRAWFAHASPCTPAVKASWFNDS